MFKEIGKLKGLLNYPQQLILGLDNIAHVNGDDLTLIITSEECAELIQAISKIKRYGFHDEYEDNLHEAVADFLADDEVFGIAPCSHFNNSLKINRVNVPCDIGDCDGDCPFYSKENFLKWLKEENQNEESKM